MGFIDGCRVGIAVGRTPTGRTERSQHPTRSCARASGKAAGRPPWFAPAGRSLGFAAHEPGSSSAHSRGMGRDELSGALGPRLGRSSLSFSDATFGSWGVSGWRLARPRRTSVGCPGRSTSKRGLLGAANAVATTAESRGRRPSGGAGGPQASAWPSRRSAPPEWAGECAASIRASGAERRSSVVTVRYRLRLSTLRAERCRFPCRCRIARFDRLAGDKLHPTIQKWRGRLPAAPLRDSLLWPTCGSRPAVLEGGQRR